MLCVKPYYSLTLKLRNGVAICRPYGIIASVRSVVNRINGNNSVVVTGCNEYAIALCRFDKRSSAIDNSKMLVNIFCDQHMHAFINGNASMC